MPNTAKVAIITALVIAFAWFGAACFRAVRKSRRLASQYGAASPEQRALLEARMASEKELEAYMLPLPRWEVAFGLGFVALMVISAATGSLK
jgi:hypothetical protein